MGGNKKAQMSIGGNDIYIHNSASGAYLQLKDDGRLQYQNTDVIKQRDHGIGSSDLGSTNHAPSLWDVGGNQPTGFYGYSPDSDKREVWGSFIKLRWNAGNQQYLIFPNFGENAMRIVRFSGGNSWIDHTVLTTGNTTVADGGFIKKASPIINIWSNGKFETNDESEGAIVERVSEGVYRIKNVLGFNADAAWGGVDGGIEIPLCKNKLPLIWVNYEVLPDGTIKLMTYHREHPNVPAFARNTREGYSDGDLIDIPSGRFVSVRVQMPATEDDTKIATPAEDQIPIPVSGSR
ncbi:hypothetical protein [Xenorhabdus bovienii]|uniref:phage tail fiber protein n=1 Tax=Xenorhabdus bovienii TaxID=40576 RepID=UPI00237D2581|nr:hypothetical protein [Xenorhabdus bovienii]MDE1476435.1 hypothetical protein [Xenorhabdus bovienii]